MRVILVLMLLVLAVGTGLAYGNDGITHTVAALGGKALSQPAALLLSGGFLIVFAGAVRRFTFDTRPGVNSSWWANRDHR